MRKLLQNIKERMQEGKDSVLVSIIASQGSTPRGAGAHMLVGTEGRIAGTIGGGAVEYRAIQLAAEFSGIGRSQVHSFSLNEKNGAELGMICGGDVTVQFLRICAQDRQMQSFVASTEQALAAGKRAWMLRNVTEGKLFLYGEEDEWNPELPEAVREQLTDKPQQLEVDGVLYYSEQLIGSQMVWIFGGGHVAQALVPILAATEFRCVVLEDREEFCDAALFPGAERVQKVQPQDWERTLQIKEEDAVCIMTRGHKNDLECQSFALRTPAGYIGVIGSRRKIAATNARLREFGFSEQEIARITTPIGLEIGAQTPAEIAVSIAAQLIQYRAASRK